ncbi:hypothetical protein ACKWTF_013174 [Chironomus riparius]
MLITSVGENLNKKSRIFVLTFETPQEREFGFDKIRIWNLKAKFPSKWISYIAKYSNEIISKIFESNKELTSKSILIKILNLNIQNEFEKQLFLVSYDSRNVILFWEGYDDVNEMNKNQLFNLIKTIDKDSKNLQFVSSLKSCEIDEPGVTTLSYFLAAIVLIILLFFFILIKKHY